MPELRHVPDDDHVIATEEPPEVMTVCALFVVPTAGALYQPLLATPNAVAVTALPVVSWKLIASVPPAAKVSRVRNNPAAIASVVNGINRRCVNILKNAPIEIIGG